MFMQILKISDKIHIKVISVTSCNKGSCFQVEAPFGKIIIKNQGSQADDFFPWCFLGYVIYHTQPYSQTRLSTGLKLTKTIFKLWFALVSLPCNSSLVHCNTMKYS